MTAILAALLKPITDAIAALSAKEDRQYAATQAQLLVLQQRLDSVQSGVLHIQEKQA